MLVTGGWGRPGNWVLQPRGSVMREVRPAVRLGMQGKSFPGYLPRLQLCVCVHTLVCKGWVSPASQLVDLLVIENSVSSDLHTRSASGADERTCHRSELPKDPGCSGVLQFLPGLFAYSQSSKVEAGVGGGPVKACSPSSFKMMPSCTVNSD